MLLNCAITILTISAVAESNHVSDAEIVASVSEVPNKNYTVNVCDETNTKNS